MFQTIYNLIYYHAAKAYFKLLIALRLMTRDEYRWRKTILRHGSAGQDMLVHGARWYKQNFEPYLIENKEVLHEKYFRLIDGLDDESVNITKVIVSRLVTFFQNGMFRWKRMLFVATEVEANLLKKQAEEFLPNVVTFPNGVSNYKNWLLRSEMRSEVFFEKHFIGELVNLNKLRNKDILDVGAFVGDSSLVLQDYTDKKVYAFDPNPTHIEKINGTIKLNNSDKIVPVPYGLGDKTEGTFMKNVVSGTSVFTGTGVPVNITTLDEWLKGNNVEVGLIKVDIEGYEQKFLAGAVETIRRYKPAILISLYHNASDLFEVKPMIDSLNLGYKFKIRPSMSDNKFGDAILICEVRD
jgi:FkbM family methyltransferase